jgi:hypothetical protein
MQVHNFQDCVLSVCRVHDMNAEWGYHVNLFRRSSDVLYFLKCLLIISVGGYCKKCPINLVFICVYPAECQLSPIKCIPVMSRSVLC